MTQIETTKFLNAMQENEEYARRVAEAKDPDALAALFNEIGIDVSAEEAADYLNQAQARIDAGELDDEMLEAVNGGGAILAYLGTCAAFGAGAGIVAGLIVVGLYYAYKKSQKR